MHKLSLGQNAWGNETEIHISDSEIITTEKQTNVQLILDANRRLRNDGGGLRKKGLRHVARIDMVTYHNWRKEWREKYADKWEFKTYFAMKLRDRDFDKFRTSDMKI